MPLYTYQCSKCKKLFEEFGSYKEIRILSECCGEIAFRRNFLGAPFVLVKGTVGSPHMKRIREVNKLKPDERPLDGGIPFGEVPGDDDYKRKVGPKIGDKDYLGPLP